MFRKHWLTILISSFAFVFWYYLVDKQVGYPQWQDWDQAMSYFKVVDLDSISSMGFPTWNLRACGGYPGLAHPTSPILSPLLFLFWIFPVPLALRFWVFIFYILGYWGMFRYLRTVKLSTLSACFGSIVFVYGGLYANAVWGSGMYALLPLILLPHISYYLEIYNQGSRVNYRVLYSLVFWLAFMFFSGLHYVYIPLLYVGVSILFVAKKYPNMLHKVWKYFLVLGLFVLISGPKLFPTVLVMTEYPRVADDNSSGQGILTMLSSLVTRDLYVPPDLSVNNKLWQMDYGIDENSTYVGIGVFILFCLGLIIGIRTKIRLDMYIVLGVFVWLSIGTSVFPSLYSLFKLLPFTDMLRIAQRFRYVWIIPLVFFSSLGFQYIFQSKNTLRKILGGVFILFIYLDLVGIGLLNINKAGNKTVDLKRTQHSNSNFLQYSCDQFIPPQSYMYTNLVSGMAVGPDACYDNIPIKYADVCKFQDEYPSFAMLLPNTPIRVDYLKNNHIRVYGEFAPRSRLVINTNYDSGWNVSYGGSTSKSVSIRIDENKGEYLGYVFPEYYQGYVDFRYKVGGLSQGIITFIIAMIGWIVVLRLRS